MSKLELYYPSKPFWIYQKFGESLACSVTDSSLPLLKRKVITKVNGVCPIGSEELYPLLGMKGHTGLDLMASRGTTLRATIKGTIEEIQTEPERGLGVGIISDEKFDFGEYGIHYVKVRQWHLMSIDIKLGDKVEVWTSVGKADSTGLSSADHNHYEIKPVENDENGNWYNVFQANGFYGAVNPEPYFNKYFAQDAQLVIGILQKIIELLKLSLTLFKK